MVFWNKSKEMQSLYVKQFGFSQQVDTEMPSCIDDLTAHVGDFGLAKFLSETRSSIVSITSSKAETRSIAIRGTIGYIPPEYGAGGEVSTQGDIYSYGICLLEMFTGKRPTDQMFKDGLNLHDFSKLVLTHQVMEAIDVRLLSEETHIEDINSVNKIKECLSSIIRIGVACSVDVMNERMNIKDVLKELHSIKAIYLQV
ncbi:Leucine-rich repeat receptor protein kinase ems1 [Thalictrum thalictroides]|uniref:Leucine-rich repeat receptor protein kinase ems1 n=1 Tax=Thalictrum thalictroides TaxID=46969 RepID=A0A7J6VB77_THATH|nr:Leucine-rich repeat receptor protein kinase ems1 [Thalictrum thalictroides]